MHLMLDLETVGKRAGCAILSIGAVSYDPESEKIGEKIHIGVDVVSCVKHGLALDPGTLMWWLEKSNREFPKPAYPLPKALMILTDFFRHHGCDSIWSNGATFDIPIIKAAYENCDLAAPWQYWNEYDTRTIFWLAKYKGSPTRGVNTHSALEDSLNQVRLIQEAIKKIRGGDGV